MSEPQEAAGEIAPPEATEEIATPSEATAESETSAEPTRDPIGARVDRAKRSAINGLLTELGASSVDELKSLFTEGRDAIESKKSELQRLQEQAERLSAQAARAASLESTVRQYADAELAQLSDDERGLVADFAGDDPAKALDFARRLRAVRPSPAKVAPFGAPAATTTAAAKAAPQDAPEPVSDKRSELQALKASNPLMAALYSVAHQRDVYG